MSDKDIKNSYENSGKRIRGDNKIFASKLTRNDTNDPQFHHDIHDTIQVDYDGIEKSPSMEEVHKWLGLN